MHTALIYNEFFPEIFPQKMSGKITYKIRIKKEAPRKDQTHALYVLIYQDRKSKKLPLNLSVPLKQFDSNKQRVKPSHKYYKDYNLVIEKKLADINTIEINYRLNNDELTIDKLLEDLSNPSLRVSFYKFWEQLMEYQHEKKIIKYETYKQQRATLRKLQEFKSQLLFIDITEKYFAELRAWLKNTKQQAPATIEIVFKNFKKYLHAANDKGIKTTITFDKIQVKKTRSNFTFLLPEEVKSLYKLWLAENINQTWKDILQRYLFSCFTGLRISDIKALTLENFIDDNLVFISQKSGKLQRIKLNNTAKSLIELPDIFNGSYSDNTINNELKGIAHACGINKRVYFHSSRHTFATNYLIAGGQIRNLQRALGHSKLETTELYAHVVDALMNDEIGKLDDIIN